MGFSLTLQRIILAVNQVIIFLPVMTKANSFNPQLFYSKQGQISDPGSHADQLTVLPESLPELVKAIQGVMLHLHWASRYGITLTKVRKNESNLRTMQARLAKVMRLCDAPLSQGRLLTQKTVGTCRDFALMLTAILRWRGIPARARCGFGTYFTKGKFEDHWVCEYWMEGESRWVMVDSQLDELQRNVLKIDFDPLDMPKVKFVTGGQAWQLCRSKQADPKRFGIFDMHGLNFIKGNLIRDFLALNKIEILPWDNFGLIRKSTPRMKPKEWQLMDRLASISSGADRDFVLLRAAFAANQEKLLPDYFQ